MDGQQDRPPSVPAWLRDSAAWAWRLLLLALAVYALGWVLLRVRVVFVPVIVALLLAAIMAPAAGALHRIRLPRILATWTVFLLAAAVLAGLGWVLVTSLGDQLGDSSQWEDVRQEVRNWLQTGPLDLSESQVNDLEDRVSDALAGGLGNIDSSRIRLAADIVAGILLALVLAFFFVKDGPAMWSWSVQHFHPRRQEVVDDAGRAAFGALAAYMRGVAITGLVDGVAIGIGLYIIGVPLALPLAVITFFGAFFPIVGATLAGALAALVALVTNGVGDAVLVALLTLVVQQVEGDLIMPLVMARQVRLHPAVVLTALAAGGAVAGIVGAFVAVPIAAMATAASASTRAHRRRLREGGPADRGRTDEESAGSGADPPVEDDAGGPDGTDADGTDDG